MRTTSALLIVVFLLFALFVVGFGAGLLVASGREVVCDNYNFHEFDVPYAVQATCSGGQLVTILD